MKFKENTIFKNAESTLAFLQIEEFKGQTTTISLDYLTQLTDFLKVLKKMGFPAVDIGIENGHPLLIFLSKEQKTAFVIAPRIEEK